jgi:hypothetical protein
LRLVPLIVFGQFPPAYRSAIAAATVSSPNSDTACILPPRVSLVPASTFYKWSCPSRSTTAQNEIAHSASNTQRKPTVPERSLLGAISKYLPCSMSR